MKKLLKGTVLLAALLGASAIGGEITAKDAPTASFAVVQCKNIVIWVITKDGKTFRVDREHHPKPEEMQAFLAWLGTGPQDLVEWPCAIST